MNPPYRVQEYIFEMGAYHKHQIIDRIRHEDYCKRNVFHNGFYVILPSSDMFGEKLPQIIRNEQEGVDLVRKHEIKIFMNQERR